MFRMRILRIRQSVRIFVNEAHSWIILVEISFDPVWNDRIDLNRFSVLSLQIPDRYDWSESRTSIEGEKSAT